MAFDAGNRTWKIPVYDLGGNRAGLLRFRQLVYRCGVGEEILNYYDRSWPPRLFEGHRETLFVWKGDEKYYILVHTSPELGDDDRCSKRTPEEAAQWILDGGFDLPADLAAYRPSATQLAPLTEAQQAVWDGLARRALTAKQLAHLLPNESVTEDSIRKRVESIIQSGRVIKNKRGAGYYRPDSPPPEWTAERNSG